MTVTAPPRPPRRREPVRRPPPRPGLRDAVERREVEALIEAARRRARRRRWGYGAGVALVALVGLAVATLVEGAAPSQTASPGPAAASVAGPGARSPIAFVVAAPDATLEGPVELRLIDPVGGRQRALARFPVWYGPSPPVWSPDGRRIAFMSAPPGESEEIAVVGVDGGRQRVLTRHAASDQGPVWSPDGRMIAFSRADYRMETNPRVIVMNADGSGERRVAFGGGPVWSPDGRRMVFGSDRYGRPGGVYVVGVDGRGLRRLTRGTSAYPDAPLAWTADGTIVFGRGFGPPRLGGNPRRVELYEVRADGTAERRLLRGVGEASRSPDGRMLAFASGGGIHVVNADGSGRRALTQDGREPVWSSDGRMIAFVRTRGTHQEIHVVNADGSGRRRIARLQASELRLAWAPARTR